jgi:DinB superfamily
MHAVLQQVFDSYRAELSGKPTDWCQLHPGQDERLWSAQEVIEHLVLTCRSTSRVLDKRLERGRPTADHSSPAQWLLQLFMLSFGRMPRGAPAPVFARPDQLHWPPMNGAELVDLLRQEIEPMDALLDRCRERFGLQRVATHFVLGPLRPDQWRRFHVVHLRHHLGQLHRLQEAISRPVAHEASVA